MPTYEYRCKACSHALEIFHSMTEAPKKKCPQCGKPRLERLISSGAGIVFKGSGFYQTDYRSESYKSAQQAESEAAKPAAKDAAQPPKPAAKDAAQPDAGGKQKPRKKTGGDA
jgi:putative FmdB family regulatory protein